MNPIVGSHREHVGHVGHVEQANPARDGGDLNSCRSVCPAVYVHLDHGRSPSTWSKAYEKGQVFEEQPYGYHWAEPWVQLSYSNDASESKLATLCRRGLKFLLGFDLIHAFQNRQAAYKADVIWTHTEAEYLADAVLMKLGLMPRIPLIGQSVWLWDKWTNWNPLRRRVHRWLLDEVTIATTLSSLNAKLGSDAIGRKVFSVPFGIEPTFEVPPSSARADRRLQVVAPGNDRHRDWHTLQQVARDNPDIEVLVLSGRRRARRLMSREVPNFIVRRVAGVAELIAAYATADVIAIPLLRNMHASGITVAMEGISAGRPVVVTRTGGIDDYLGDAAHYVELGDTAGLALAIRTAAALSLDPKSQATSRSHLAKSGLMARDFGRRHVLLTRLALGIGTSEEERQISHFSLVELEIPNFKGGASSP